MIESKFTYKAYLNLAIIILIPTVHLSLYFNGTVDETAFPIFFLIIPVFLVIIFSLGTFRTQMIKVTINSREMTVRSYFGFGPEKKYRLKDLQGFHTSTVTARSVTYDTLYVMKDDRKVAKISSQYISNYYALHNIISTNLTYLGYIETNLKTEFKDTIKF